ncbi:MAG: aminotransferase class I/II-fold pyridoxal phosphate-dependent enzyme [Clostridia bacterium]|nr:aminotransferase class I/II-fold pyridoxal phosphate-dependent enzyme [Clostridia bacterium]
MRKFFTDEKVLQNCKIFRMLDGQSRAHLSFHTPGHKINGFDITELSYSDNLSCPRGCIAEAERDIAELLGAEKSFILTDGSTSGVLSIFHAARAMGAKSVAVCEGSHKSVFNACALLGLTPLLYPAEKRDKIPHLPTVYELKSEYTEIFSKADALFFTSPDYYGNVANLQAAREFCNKEGKLLLVDGAHGGHLRFDKSLHAGAYADFWVDGVHKSLPALTQGAVASARTKEGAEKLRTAVDIFRTTSPSYPIMASVEYAVKYPRNEELEKAVRAYAKTQARVIVKEDWTKLYARFGGNAFEAEKALEAQGVFAEFCDGNGILFYLSPATKGEDFQTLVQVLKGLFEKFPITENGEEELTFYPLDGEKEWVSLEQAEGRICAGLCGAFPPCTPLFALGERISAAKIRLLQNADNVFGLYENQILVLKEKNEE